MCTVQLYSISDYSDFSIQLNLVAKLPKLKTSNMFRKVAATKCFSTVVVGTYWEPKCIYIYGI